MTVYRNDSQRTTYGDRAAGADQRRKNVGTVPVSNRSFRQNCADSRTISRDALTACHGFDRKMSGKNMRRGVVENTGTLSAEPCGERDASRSAP